MKKALFAGMSIFLIAIGCYVYNLYTSFSDTIDSVYTPLERDTSEKHPADIQGSETQPISILLLGVDQRRTDPGRSDAMMVVALNPKQNTMKIVSIPRDTYVDIIGKGKKDKINHAYAFGGIDMSVKTTEKFLDIPINYYIVINMEGFRDMVDALGGIDVHNAFAFTSEGMMFTKGDIHLNGAQALKYARMRKEDPSGDSGRQMRQRQVFEAILQKGNTFSTITKWKEILKVVEKYVQTNIKQNQMWNFQKNYATTLNKKEEIQIIGKGQKLNGIWYYIVSEKDRMHVSNQIKKYLE